MEKLNRTSGILMHITSLPNEYGWGTFSHSAFDFVDFLSDGGFGVWQVLPFAECLYGNSPYSSISSFAINPRFLDLTEFLNKDELVSLGLENLSSFDDYNQKADVAIETICNKYFGIYDYSKFEKQNKYWLDDYALYKCIKKSQNDKPWFEWSLGLKNRVKLDIDNFKIAHAKEIEKIKFIQYLLNMQWQKIKSYANSKKIEIFGDIPFYVELDSCDVWVNPKNWQLTDGKPKLVAGVPPDYFNSEGQLWGNPIYDFCAMAKNKYDFWVKRIKRQSELFDIIRIDHFIAFSRYWAIPYESQTAKSGKWVKGVGNTLLKVILDKCKVKIVAEDLGIVTKDVIALKDKFEIPGLKVLEFAFDDIGDNMYQPHNYEKNCVAYLGTHDNNTMMGMLNEGNWDKINRFKKYLCMPLQESNDQVIENSILALYKSSANVVIFSTQDILHLGQDSRMNVPGTKTGNWEWKLGGNLNRDMCAKFRDWAQTYGRIK